MNKNKQLTINMLASMVSFIINIGIGFFLTPFITRNIGVAAYGFVSLGTQFINYASLVTIALNSMASRFITIEIHKQNWEKANQYFNSVLIANLATAAFLMIPSIFVITFLEKIVDVPKEILLDVKILFAFLFFNYLVSSVLSSFGVSTFATNKLHLKSMRDIQAKIINATLILVLFAFFKPIVSYVGFATVISMLYISFSNIYFTKKFLPDLKLSKIYFQFKLVLELVSNGIWNTVTKLSGILSTGLDLLMANTFINAQAMGSLALAKSFPTIILNFFAVLGSIFAPQLTFSYAKDDLDGMQRELKKSIKLLGVFSSIPVVFLLVYGDVFYKLWLPTQDPLLLQRLSVLSCAAFVFSLPIEGLWNIFTVVNKVKKVSLFLLMNAILSFIITFGLLLLTKDTNTRLYLIAGVSTIFSIIRSLTFLPMYGAYCLRLKWHAFYPSLLSNLSLVAVTTMLAVIVRRFVIVDTWLGLIIMVLILSIFSISLSYFVLLNKNEKTALRKLLSLRKAT